MKLAFIGPVGVGKTTLMYDLIGLHVKDTDAKSGEDIFRKVLTTASGWTTACEVKIFIRDEVRIDGHCPPPEEMYTTIDTFSWALWKEAKKPLPEEMAFLASEVLKVMRNLLRLNGTAGSELSQEYAEFEGLYRELLQRHEAEDRSQTELVFSGPEAQALRWAADHSKKLNLGTLPGFSLP